MKLKAELAREVTIHRDGKAVRVLESCEAEIDWPDAHEPNCGIVKDQTRGAWQIVKFISNE